jgi:hypothetical protein
MKYGGERKILKGLSANFYELWFLFENINNILPCMNNTCLSFYSIYRPERDFRERMKEPMTMTVTAALFALTDETAFIYEK